MYSTGSTTSTSSRDSSSSSDLSLDSVSAVIGTGCLTLVLASALALAVWRRHSRGRIHTPSGTTHEPPKSSSSSSSQGVAATPIVSKSNAIVDLSLYPGGSLTVYFATQTGTAESLARDIEREGPSKGFLVHVVDVEDIVTAITTASNSTTDNDTHEPTEAMQCALTAVLAPRSLFLVSTYGEGEAPDHAVAFVKQMQAAANLESILSTASAAAAVAPTSDDTYNNNNETKQTRSTAATTTVEYAVFGLGNRQYDHYNAMGQFIDRALHQLGAHRLVPLGLGDDNLDLEADFEAWKDSVWWPAVLERYRPVAVHSHDNDDVGGGGRLNVVSAATQGTVVEAKLPDCPLHVTYHTPPRLPRTTEQQHNAASLLTTVTSATTLPNYNLLPEQIHSSSRHYFTAVECPVTLVRELQSRSGSSSSSDDSTVHVEIDISAAKFLSTNQTRDMENGQPVMTYTTADNLGVLPCNDATVVERVAQALGYDLEAIFSVTPAPGHEWHGAAFPMPCTVREYLTRYCDVTSAPRRSDLRLLASYCRDPVDRTALLRMAAKEGRAEYKEKILDSYTGLVDLLHKCPSLQLPLEHFLNVCSPLQTRFFTIASSSSQHPTTIHLTVAVTKHVRPSTTGTNNDDQSLFHGVCSTHLSNLGVSAVLPHPTVRVFHRPSSFRLPVDSTRPIIMIGPGTGVAPMRAFLQERAYQRDVLKLSLGTNILYFGCKQKSHDFIYKDELEEYVASGVLTHLRVAFSRDQSAKIYVQHLIQEHAVETWTLLDDKLQGGAYIYVCGGVKMGQDVSEALRVIISSQGDMSLVAAKEYLTKLSHDGRFVQELWA